MRLIDLVENALYEDMPDGDLTTNSLGLGQRNGAAKLIAKEDLVLSGLQLFELTVLQLDQEAKLKWQFKDGDLVLKGQTVCSIQSDLCQLLKAERVALNFMGRLSGIATFTRCFVEKVAGTKTRILDTRKTTPGYRELEKKAVRDGGGQNHRMNLSAAVLIKENHARAVGDLAEAIRRAKAAVRTPIEVEAHSLNDVKVAVQMGVGRILLDNMDNATLQQALELIPSHIETEASGNMSLDRVASVAQLGVNYISVGALTHSVPSADLSLLFDWTSTSK